MPAVQQESESTRLISDEGVWGMGSAKFVFVVGLIIILLGVFLGVINIYSTLGILVWVVGGLYFKKSDEADDKEWAARMQKGSLIALVASAILIVIAVVIYVIAIFVYILLVCFIVIVAVIMGAISGGSKMEIVDISTLVQMYIRGADILSEHSALFQFADDVVLYPIKFVIARFL